MKKKAIIISGPTASGKTALALEVVRHIPSVIVNADSRQIYKGVDIVVGKDIPKNSIFHPHILQDSDFDIGYFEVPYSKIYLTEILSSFDHDFSITDYIYSVKNVVSHLGDDPIPVFVGGSNFYISSLINPPETATIPPNIGLRKKLDTYQLGKLQTVLKELDNSKFLSMNDSDRKNPRRLVRSIEIGEWKKNHKTTAELSVLADYEVLHIGLIAPLDLLRKKIDARVDARISEGAREEAEKLFSSLDFLSSTLKTTNGYRELFEYFQGKISYSDAIQKWKYSEYHNAKKQLTWLTNDSNIKKYSIVQPHFSEIVLEDILEFLSPQLL
jgi:tRNA dimethylallyltransferase